MNIPEIAPETAYNQFSAGYLGFSNMWHLFSMLEMIGSLSGHVQCSHFEFKTARIARRSLARFLGGVRSPISFVNTRKATINWPTTMRGKLGFFTL